jgi:hypothetical protein
MRLRPTPEQQKTLQQLSFNALIGANQLARQIGSYGLARMIPPPSPQKSLLLDEAWLFMAPREGRSTHHHVFAGPGTLRPAHALTTA